MSYITNRSVAMTERDNFYEFRLNILERSWKVLQMCGWVSLVNIWNWINILFQISGIVGTQFLMPKDFIGGYLFYLKIALMKYETNVETVTSIVFLIFLILGIWKRKNHQSSILFLIYNGLHNSENFFLI